MDVLIADDDPSSRQYLELVLAKLGHTVTTADDGVGAMAILREFQFDAVVLDWEMPGADGAAVARWFRTEAGDRKTPVFAVSAHQDLEMRPEYREAGFDGYVMKPYTMQELASLLAGAGGGGERDMKTLDEAVWGSYAELLSGAGHDVSAAAKRILGAVREWLELTTEATLDLSRVHSMAGSCAIVGARALSDALRNFQATAPAASGESRRAELRQIAGILEATEREVERRLPV